MSPVDQLLDDLAERVVTKLVERLSGDDSQWVDQHSSPLGSRRHIRAIRDGKLPGRKVGRRFVATRADVQRYLGQPVEQPKPEPKPKRKSDAEVARELGLRLVTSSGNRRG